LSINPFSAQCEPVLLGFLLSRKGGIGRFYALDFYGAYVIRRKHETLTAPEILRPNDGMANP
jgi:hypothetical protein